MKYIRTKDKIITNDNTKEIDKAYFNDEPMLQSDTIEELCDEYVWVWNKNEFPYSTLRRYVRIGGLGDLMREIRCQLNYGKNLNYDYEVFGAIWTNKGLIYVAKMKDVLPNGEIGWELL